MIYFSLLLINNIVLIVLVISIVIGVFIMRNKLLKLWQTVTRLELIFNKKLLDTLKLYKKNTTLLKQFQVYKALTHYEIDQSKNIRLLKLEERQQMFKHLQKVYSEIYRLNDPKYKPLSKQFEALQIARVQYNTKVLLYNQKIHTYPYKFFAKRMNFIPKEYFG